MSRGSRFVRRTMPDGSFRWFVKPPNATRQWWPVQEHPVKKTSKRAPKGAYSVKQARAQRAKSANRQPTIKTERLVAMYRKGMMWAAITEKIGNMMTRQAVRSRVMRAIDPVFKSKTSRRARGLK